MIEIVEGVGVGAGKSYYTCTRIIGHLAAGGTVFASETFGLVWDATKALVEERYGLLLQPEQYETFPQSDIPRLHEVTPKGTGDCPLLVVVDEAHMELNCRDFADKSKRPFFQWLTQSRHDDTDVIFISQAAANMDKQIARLATYVFRVRNLLGFSLPGLGKLPRFLAKYFVLGKFDRDGKTLQERRFLRHDVGIFRCYSTKVMRGAHKRREGEIPRIKLTKSQKRNPKMVKFILLVLVVCVGLSVYRFMKVGGVREFFGVKAPPVTQPVAAIPKSGAPEAPKPQAVIPPKPPLFTVANEGFRGQIGDTILHTDSGQYEVGVMSKHGLCMAVGRGVAEFLTAERGKLYVVTSPVGAVASGTPPAVATKQAARGAADIHEVIKRQDAYRVQAPPPAPPRQGSEKSPVTFRFADPSLRR